MTIKNNDIVISTEEKIMNEWKEYFQRLSNVEREIEYLQKEEKEEINSSNDAILIEIRNRRSNKYF